MSLRDKIQQLELDSAYMNLIDRLDVETEAVMGGAGDEENWYAIFDQLRNYENEHFLR